MKNFVIVRTGGGRQYARRIASSIRWLNRHIYKKEKFSVEIIGVNNITSTIWGKNTRNTVVYSRAAYPDENGWMKDLIEFERQGITVVNSTATLLLTSNKLACALHLQGKVSHPVTWEINKRNPEEYYEIFQQATDSGVEDFVVKPLTSISQGANVQKFSTSDIDSRGDLDNILGRVPGNKIVLQEYVPYNAIHRVIVIGGHAIPYTFVDYANDPRKNGEWKVSVCLNKTTMRFNGNPDPELLKLAEQTQREVGGEINFIDIFSVPDGSGNTDETPYVYYTISEINTACNLTIHERLAKKAGRSDWNIHYRIAKYLVEKAMNR